MEAEFIEWLRDRVPSATEICTGIGDDAAVVRTPHELCVLTSDMLMDGTDFELQHCEMQRVGRKSLAVNLSDVAAMACRPVTAIISLALPKHGGRQLATDFYDGLLPLANEFSVAIAGGDTNTWEGRFVVSVTLLGTPVGSGPLLRSGGEFGDEILVTGEFGGSILGRHFDFQPRVSDAIWLRENVEVHAAIDVSDGLSLDLARLSQASGCGAVVDLDQVPVSEAAHELARSSDGQTALDHALSDGEDFELILAVPPATARQLLAEQPLDSRLTRIGKLVREPGLWQDRSGEPPQPLAARGYEH